MNSCEYYQEMISRIIDGELSEEGRAVLAQHLRECAACAAVYDAFAGISQAIDDDIQEPPAALAANVMAYVRRGKVTELADRREKPAIKGAKNYSRARKKKSSPIKPILAAAACLALVVAAAFTLPVFRGAKSAVFPGDEARQASGIYAAKNSDVDAAAGISASNEPAAAPPAAMTDTSQDSAIPEAAPAEAASVQAEEAEEEIIVSNVYKIEILYAGSLVEDFTMRIGEAPIRLTGKIYPISVKESPEWRSSDESIITVTAGDDGSCIVEAVGAGSAKVIAEYAGKTGECWVRVAADAEATAAEGLEIHYAGSRIYEFTMHVGDANIPLKGVLSEELAGSEISWLSTDESIIRVHDTNDGWCAVEAVDEGGASVILQCGELKVRCKVYVVEMPKES